MNELTTMHKWLGCDLDGWWAQHIATGMRHGHIRHPEGQPPTPYGCRRCGYEQDRHGLQYLRGRGSHRWVAPTSAQILARMQARRNAFKDACRCEHPWLRVNPWRCEADECVMHDELLRGWMTPLSGAQATALMGGAS